MYYLHCIHSPVGATAHSAAIGGESVHALGYQFVDIMVVYKIVDGAEGWVYSRGGIRQLGSGGTDARRRRLGTRGE